MHGNDGSEDENIVESDDTNLQKVESCIEECVIQIPNESDPCLPIQNNESVQCNFSGTQSEPLVDDEEDRDWVSVCNKFLFMR